MEVVGKIYEFVCTIAHFIADANPVELPTSAGDRTINRLDKLRHSSGPLPTAEIRRSMQKTMQNHAAVFRDGPVLRDGVQKMLDVAKSFGEVGITDRSLTWLEQDWVTG